MPWFKVDDNLGFHHKVIAAGNPAMGLWVRAGAICAQQLTDGFVADHMAATLGTRAQAQRLVEVGLWERVEGGYSFHEWATRQPSKAYVEAERAAAADRMRENRARKREAARKASSQVSDSRSPERTQNERRTNSEVREVFGNPDPTRPDPTRPINKSSSSEIADAIPDPEPNRPEVIELCDRLADRIEANGAKRPTIGKTWHTAARLLIDRDGYTVEQVAWLIDKTQADEFWRANILSMPKLRAKADQLKLKFRANGTTQPVDTRLPNEPNELPPDGLTDAEMWQWHTEQRAKRQALRAAGTGGR